MTSPAFTGLPALTVVKSAFLSTAASRAVPAPGMVKIAGAVAATVTLNAVLGPTPLFTTTVAGPAGTSTGTCALICEDETYRSGASLPAIVTFTPLSEGGSLRPTQPVRSVATCASRSPKNESSPPGATVVVVPSRLAE